jgi:hypothetical protein
MSSEFVISLLMGGVSAAAVTAAFNVWWDRRKQEIAERWERRRYDTNVKLHILHQLTEIFYATESELHFVALEVSGFHQGLQAVEQQVSLSLQIQNPGMPVAQLQILRDTVLAPIRLWIGQMEVNRWSQYNNSARALRARAEALVSLAEYSLTTEGVYARIATMFQQLSENLAPGVQGAQNRLQKLRNREQEFKDILRQIRDEARGRPG